MPRGPELQIVISRPVRHEPGKGVVELPVVVVPAARPRELVVVEARVTPLGRAGHLVSAILEPAVGAPARVAPVGRFVGARHPYRVDLVAPDDARVGPDENLIVVGLVLNRVQRRRPAADQVELRRQLAQPAERPGVARVDLVVDPDQVVPRPPLLREREAQIRPHPVFPRPARVDDLPLEAEEEVRLSRARGARRACPRTRSCSSPASPACRCCGRSSPRRSSRRW